MPISSETTYRVVGIKFDGSREIVSEGENFETAKQKRLLILFKKEYPAAAVESEEQPVLTHGR